LEPANVFEVFFIVSIPSVCSWIVSDNSVNIRPW
jgi:hypothetical protein